MRHVSLLIKKKKEKNPAATPNETGVTARYPQCTGGDRAPPPATSMGGTRPPPLAEGGYPIGNHPFPFPIFFFFF